MNIIELKFTNINQSSTKESILSVDINDGRVGMSSIVKSNLLLDFEAQEQNTLKIYFVNKEDTDTVTDDNGNIVSDMNFELESIKIDGIDIEDLKWQGNYHTDKQMFESCLFFGPKGYYQLNFSTPILKWTLEQNHLKNKNDPNWEEDYNYYTEAWNRLHSN